MKEKYKKQKILQMDILKFERALAEKDEELDLVTAQWRE